MTSFKRFSSAFLTRGEKKLEKKSRNSLVTTYARLSTNILFTIESANFNRIIFPIFYIIQYLTRSPIIYSGVGFVIVMKHASLFRVNEPIGARGNNNATIVKSKKPSFPDFSRLVGYCSIVGPYTRRIQKVSLIMLETLTRSFFSLEALHARHEVRQL